MSEDNVVQFIPKANETIFPRLNKFKMRAVNEALEPIPYGGQGIDGMDYDTAPSEMAPGQDSA